MQSLPPPERRPSLLHGVGVLVSAMIGLALTVGLFAVGAVLVAVIGGALLLAGGGIALALRLGWKPTILRQAQTWQQRASRGQPLDGEYTVVERGDSRPRG